MSKSKSTTQIKVPVELVEHILMCYDVKKQPMICVEELAELQQAISKECRGALGANIPEEIAHSLISISVIMTIYGINPVDIEYEIKKKQIKLGMRVDEKEDKTNE